MHQGSHSDPSGCLFVLFLNVCFLFIPPLRSRKCPLLPSFPLPLLFLSLQCITFAAQKKGNLCLCILFFFFFLTNCLDLEDTDVSVRPQQCFLSHICGKKKKLSLAFLSLSICSPSAFPRATFVSVRQMRARVNAGLFSGVVNKTARHGQPQVMLYNCSVSHCCN